MGRPNNPSDSFPPPSALESSRLLLTRRRVQTSCLTRMSLRGCAPSWTSRSPTHRGTGGPSSQPAQQRHLMTQHSCRRRAHSHLSTHLVSGLAMTQKKFCSPLLSVHSSQRQTALPLPFPALPPRRLLDIVQWAFHHGGHRPPPSNRDREPRVEILAPHIRQRFWWLCERL